MSTNPSSRRSRLSRLSLLTAGITLSCALHAQDARHAVNLPPQPLDQALNALAGQTGARILFATDSAEGLQAPGLSGELSVEQALQRLLRGTRLKIQKSGDGSYLVSAPASVSSSAVELGATSVNASGLGATSENTGSYTTGSMSSGTKLNLSARETPQSVSVVSRQRMDDQAMTTLGDAVKYTPGLTLTKWGGERERFNSRGFQLNNLMVDGIPVQYEEASLSTGLLSITTGSKWCAARRA